MSAAADIRVGLFDEMRGLFVLWMIVSHSLTLANLAPTHPLQYFWPRGWSTVGFVLLTGLVLGTRHSRSADRLDPIRRQALYRRAVILGLIAVVSNIVFLLLREVLEGQLTRAYVIDTVMLRNRWNISAVLLPSASLLLLAPALQHGLVRLGTTRLFAVLLVVITALEVVVDYWTQAELRAVLRSASLDGRYFYFPVLLMLRLAILSYAWGAFLATRGSSVRYIYAAAAAAVVILSTEQWIRWPAVAVAPSRFAVVLAVMTVVQHVRPLAPVRAGLAFFGSAALLLFLGHRAILQTSVRVLHNWLAGDQLFVALLAVTLAGCIWLAWFRRSSRWFSERLGPLGF